MQWRRKAQIQRTCAALPGGASLYVRIQRRFGNLRPDPSQRVPHHLRMLARLRSAGFDVAGARCIEVGTGHLPILPLLFYLAGADEVVTVDLHRRLQQEMSGQVMSLLVDSPDDLARQYEGLVDEAVLRERLLTMRQFASRPRDFFAHAGIRYAAPGDAAAMPDPSDSFDLHFSTTVLEHIEPAVLGQILIEAQRLLRPDGGAYHIIDPSDHFAHSDASIALINFLRFSDREWDKLAGNEFGYCNRLRAPELIDMFSDAGLELIDIETVIDERSKREIESGFPLDPAFARFSPDDLCSVTVDVLARPSGVSIQRGNRPMTPADS